MENRVSEMEQRLLRKALGGTINSNVSDSTPRYTAASSSTPESSSLQIPTFPSRQSNLQHHPKSMCNDQYNNTSDPIVVYEDIMSAEYLDAILSCEELIFYERPRCISVSRVDEAVTNSMLAVSDDDESVTSSMLAVSDDDESVTSSMLRVTFLSEFAVSVHDEAVTSSMLLYQSMMKQLQVQANALVACHFW